MSTSKWECRFNWIHGHKYVQLSQSQYVVTNWIPFSTKKNTLYIYTRSPLLLKTSAKHLGEHDCVRFRNVPVYFADVEIKYNILWKNSFF